MTVTSAIIVSHDGSSVERLSVTSITIKNGTLIVTSEFGTMRVPLDSVSEAWFK